MFICRDMNEPKDCGMSRLMRFRCLQSLFEMWKTVCCFALLCLIIEFISGLSLMIVRAVSKPDLSVHSPLP